MQKSNLFGNGAPLTKLPLTFPTEIDENLALGLDLGIGSCGQALVTDKGKSKHALQGIPEFPERINFLGVRAFDVPETHKETGVKLKNPERRNKIHLRRTTDRRAERMRKTRILLKEHKLLPEDYPIDPNLWKYAKRGDNTDLDKWQDWHSRMTQGKLGQEGPWVWRVKALDQTLEPLELAAVLLHLAKHRGFKSNRKSEAADDEGGKVLKALRENKSRMAENGYRTIGEMFLKDPQFTDKKRNSSGDYTAVILRKHQEEEARLIFKNQRKLGNPLATEELEHSFVELFNKQLPLQNSIGLLGDCPFEKGEKRGSRLAPSFELCRALQKLNTLSLILPTGKKVRFADHVNAAQGGYQIFIEKFSRFEGAKSNRGRITWKDLRDIFQLNDAIRFNDLPTPKTKKVKGEDVAQTLSQLEGEDFLTRSSANNAARGSSLLRIIIGADLYDRLQNESPEQLDQAAYALTFFEEIKNEHTDQKFWGVVNQMEADGLNSDLITAIEQDLHSNSPTLHKFSDTSSLSTLACRKLIPLLQKGIIYSDACTELYGDHRQNDFEFENITNPVVKSVVRECLKQVIHLIDETGKIPGRICVELARDLGKSISERNEIKQGQDKRRTNKNANRDHLTEKLNRIPDVDELLRYELAKDQTHLCPYCGDYLSGDYVALANSQNFQIDHILPRSRSHDNSFDNKVLVHTQCNQHKGNLTPFEFHEIGNSDEDSQGWLDFTTRINAMKGIRKHKRRLLLNTTFGENENKFAARHLNDTRYISKLVTHYLQEIYVNAGEKRLTEKGSTRRVFVQPGQLTSIVRKAWGLEDLKKDRDGQRLGDKHHAIDALICALLSEGQRQFITRCEQEKRGAARSAFTEFSNSYEQMEKENRFSRIPCRVSPPWKSFRRDVTEALDLFTVSRREIRKGKGSLHNDTLYSVKQEGDEKIIYARKSIISLVNGKPKADLKPAQIDKIRGINDERNQWLRDSLTQWVNAKCPVDEEKLPRDPQGNIIKKVYIAQRVKSGRQYPQGYVTAGKIIRADIYSSEGTFFIVPIYSHHLSHKTPPVRAIQRDKDENLWPEMKPSNFLFSLWINSKFHWRDSRGNSIVGYYRTLNRSRPRLEYRNPDDAENGGDCDFTKFMTSFQKIETDRLGREFLIKREKLTWRGKTIS